jgi:tetratricopeptide (TPR) repeat protein
LLRELRRTDESLSHLRRALAVYEQARGPDHVRVAEVVFDLGQTLEQAGQRAQARQQVERARRIYARAPDEAQMRQQVEQWLAEHPADAP